LAGVRETGGFELMRVLHIINSVGLGGAETLLYRLVSRDSRTEHVVVSLAPPAWYSCRLEEKGVPLHHLNMHLPVPSPRAALRLKSIIRESGADVVHCWMYRSNVFGGAIARAARKPVVWGIHCSSLEPLKLSSRTLAYLSGFTARWIADFIINCSNRSAELHEKIGYSSVEGAVIHNGYDPSIFRPDEPTRAAARESLGVTANEFVVASIARWHPQKDIPNLLAAIRAVLDRGIPIRCLLIGVGLGANNQALVAEIEKFGCSGAVVPLGARSDIQALARAIDLHVLASCGAEAFPNVVAETMLSGTPNAVTDVGDSAIIVAQTGWIVPPRNPRLLAAAIAEAYLEWAEKPTEWAARRAIARQRVVDQFSFDGMVGAYEQVWRNLSRSYAIGRI
jgi:glycosyltransferase involved in cell wall biosynthesis